MVSWTNERKDRQRDIHSLSSEMGGWFDGRMYELE